MHHQTVEEETRRDGGSSAARRNPPWQRDELILALDLYFRHPPHAVSQTHPEVIAVSEMLNALPIHTIGHLPAAEGDAGKVSSVSTLR
jgi:hypothetical protein